MTSVWIVAAGITGLVGVGVGAFGAHALKERVDAAQLVTFEVGVRYQMYHAIALLGVAWVAHTMPSRVVAAAGACMVIGVVLFSGSIYGLVLAKWRWLGPATPIGGMLLMVGWLLLAIAGARGAAGSSAPSI